MFPIQMPVLRPDEVSRCDDRIQQSDPGKAPNPTAGTDASLKASVERAIWKDEVLRAIEYYEIEVRVKNGIVHLNGHIANRTSRIRIESAIRSVSGILGVRNNLILDDKLTVEVAGALGVLEHSHGCKFFTGSSHGVISINGIVSSESIRVLAEINAARNPNVRAVINNVRVAGATATELHDLPFLQPTIDEKIYFLDGHSGVVKRVVINPNNRRVIAMLLLVNFVDARLPLHDDGPHLPTQLVHVPMDALRYLTKMSGFLLIDHDAYTRYQDFDPASFFEPGSDWTAPFPYCPQDVLFPVEYQKMVAQTQTTKATQPFPVEELLQSGVSFKEPSFATDDLGS